MTTATTYKVEELEAIRDVMKEVGNDGHTVYEATLLEGLPATLTKGLVRKQGGGAHPKSKVFDASGREVTPVGFHGLSLLWRIAGYLKVDTTEANEKFGRGSQARALTSAIVAKLGEFGFGS